MAGLRRLTTLATALCLSFAPLESLVPDVHDGDAAAAAVCSHEASHVDHEAPSPSNGRGSGSHAFHLDHCAHSHLVAIPQAGDIDRGILATRVGVIGEPAGVHESVILPPRQRPPIA